MVGCACTPGSQQVSPISSPSQTTASTITPTVSPTPTTTPDPFAGLNQCLTWRDAKQNCVVSVEDLMSGKLVDYARAVTGPFPADAYELKISEITYTGCTTYRFVPLLSKGLILDEETKQWLYGGSIWNVNNAVFEDPRSPIGEKLFFWVKGDGTSNLNFDFVAEIVKVKNQGGSDGFYTVITLPALRMGDDNGPIIDQDATEASFDDFFENMAYQPPSRSQDRFEDSGYRAILEKYGNLILEIVDEETTKLLLDEWQADGIIPKDLEKRPLIAGGFPYPGWPWAK